METHETIKYLKAANRRKIAFGLVAILFGVLWLLRNLGKLNPEFADYLFSWQVLLIAIGLIGLVGNKGQGVGWSILILIGGFFLLNDIYDFSIRLWQIFWPILVIFIGLSMVLNRTVRRPGFRNYKDISSTDILDNVAIFGGSDVKIDSQSFKGGEATAIFGGSKIDLTGARLAPGIQVIELTNIFGGNTLIIPANWNVKLEVTGILGGFKDLRPKRFDGIRDTESTLIIKGVAIFGGGEIKSI
ncbi:LiaI-LiaF-like domain-containing protein [Saccharicrinis sp. FJH62]|uniref:LiaF transmembrane domain-containing protein n=1 Tax=Saccharicrinis sp. FJH62 TaxID=3344657 RepID=UPI0035D46342